MRRSAIVFAVIAATLAQPVAAGATAPGLSGEVFSVPGHFRLHDVHCDPAGFSSFSYSVLGIALGPYPGTYRETGHVRIGPQTSPPFDRFRFFATGPVLELEATFTVDSAVGDVSGSKYALTWAGNVAACADDAERIAIIDGVEVVCPEAYLRAIAGTRLAYEATITHHATGETFTDAGGSALYLLWELSQCPGLPNFGATVFEETFHTLSPVTTPGHATGGGRVERGDTGAGVSFGFNVRSDGDRFAGNCAVLDQAGRVLVKCLDVSSVVVAGNTVTFAGTAEVDGVTTHFQVQASDGGEPNAGLDTFAIVTESGYAAGGVVRDGNVQVHRE